MASTTVDLTPNIKGLGRRGIGADVEDDEAGGHRSDGRLFDGSSVVVELKENGPSQTATNKEGFCRSGAPSPESLLARSKAVPGCDTLAIAMEQTTTTDDTRPKTPEISSTSSPLPTLAVDRPMEPRVACSKNDERRTVCKPAEEGQERFECEISVMGGESSHKGVPRGQKRSRSPVADPCKSTEPVLSHAMERYLASTDSDEFEAYQNREKNRGDGEEQQGNVGAIVTAGEEEDDQENPAAIETNLEEEREDIPQDPIPAQPLSITPIPSDETQHPPEADAISRYGIIAVREGPLEAATDRSASDSAVEDVEPTPAELHHRLQVDTALCSWDDAANISQEIGPGVSRSKFYSDA